MNPCFSACTLLHCHAAHPSSRHACFSRSSISISIISSVSVLDILVQAEVDLLLMRGALAVKKRFSEYIEIIVAWLNKYFDIRVIFAQLQ